VLCSDLWRLQVIKIKVPLHSLWHVLTMNNTMENVHRHNINHNTDSGVTKIV